MCFAPKSEWVEELQRKFNEAEERRQYAKFNTGSISLETALLLRSVCLWKKPSVAIEVGTFIGKSTAALLADTIYTCDKDNDCIPATGNVRPHPYQTSTQMFQKLAASGVKAEVFFFDGRLTDEDIPLVLGLSKPRAVYALDDYHPTIGGGKGLANARKLMAALPDYGIVEPYKPFEGRSTLALMVPPA